MSQIVVGIDPDADKYGLAAYVDGRISWLEKWSIIEFVDWLERVKLQGLHEFVFVIEDVVTNKFMYNRGIKSPSILSKVAQNVGQCKHSQKVAEQFIEHYGFKLIRQPPTKGNWAKNKNQFEQVTGWTGRSNEDNRSASFMAFLHLERINQEARKNA